MNSEKQPDFKVAHQAKLSARWDGHSPVADALEDMPGLESDYR
jgi:hypothetical protein